MLGVFINSPMRAILLASHIPQAASDELSYQASAQRYKLVWCAQFVNFQLNMPSGGSPLQLEGSCLLRTVPLDLLWLLSSPQETPFPMRKSHLLTTCQGHSEQLHDNHTYFLSHPSPTVAYFFVLSFRYEEMDAKKKVNETHLALSLRVGFLTCKGKLGFLETWDLVLNLNFVSYTLKWRCSEDVEQIFKPLFPRYRFHLQRQIFLFQIY